MNYPIILMAAFLSAGIQNNVADSLLDELTSALWVADGESIARGMVDPTTQDCNDPIRLSVDRDTNRLKIEMQGAQIGAHILSVSEDSDSRLNILIQYDYEQRTTVGGTPLTWMLTMQSPTRYIWYAIDPDNNQALGNSKSRIRCGKQEMS